MNHVKKETDTEATDLMEIPFRRDLLVMPSPESTPSDRSIDKRRIRKHFVLNVIREHGPLSRAEIAKQSGLNLPSVSSLMDDLIADGLVIEQEARLSLRGRRPIPVYLRDDAASVLGIDIGKRTTTTLLTNLRAKSLLSYERPTPELTSPEAYTAWAMEVAESILQEASGFMPPLCGIGVALPGLVSSANSDAPTVGEGAVVSGESWMAVEAMRKALSEAFGVEVLVDNDARINVPGATWFSNRQPKFKNFAVLNIGIGLGLGILANGHVLRGAQGFAGEIGHIPLGREGVPCYCGLSGCLENAASGAAIADMAKERGYKTQDVEELAQMAREGDAGAQEIFRIFAVALGRGVATIINLFNPEAIILSGKVSRAADVFLADLKTSMAAHALPAPFAETVLMVENPAKNLSSLGAVAVVLHQIFYSSHISFEEVI